MILQLSAVAITYQSVDIQDFLPFFPSNAKAQIDRYSTRYLRWLIFILHSCPKSVTWLSRNYANHLKVYFIPVKRLAKIIFQLPSCFVIPITIQSYSIPFLTNQSCSHPNHIPSVIFTFKTILSPSHTPFHLPFHSSSIAHPYHSFVSSSPPLRHICHITSS